MAVEMFLSAKTQGCHRIKPLFLFSSCIHPIIYGALVHSSVGKNVCKTDSTC